MRCRQAHTQRVRYALPILGSRFQKFRMRQCNDLFFRSAAVSGHEKLHIDRIGVAYRNAGLQPAELHFPHAPKRVRTRLKTAALVTHAPMLACGAAGFDQFACELRLTSESSSFRVSLLSRKAPNIALVTAPECCFSTPRIIMQKCLASQMTATPLGLKSS